MDRRTSKHLTENTHDVAMEAMIVGSKAIENQERRGQQALTQSALLPIKITRGTREQFEAMGIVFDSDAADDFFVPVQLPDGWTITATPHPMWSNLRDERGRSRASIFYKAAFYDRSAEMSIQTRFTASYQPVGGWASYVRDETPFEGIVKDGGDEIIWRSEPFGPELKANQFGDPSASRLAAAAAQDWLDANRPEHDNPLMRWES